MYVTVEISTHSPVGVHAPLVNWHMKSCGEKRSRLELFKRKETALHQSQKYWTRVEIICKIVPGEIYIGAGVALNERNKFLSISRQSRSVLLLESSFYCENKTETSRCCGRLWVLRSLTSSGVSPRCWSVHQCLQLGTPQLLPSDGQSTAVLQLASVWSLQKRLNSVLLLRSKGLWYGLAWLWVS